jgi:Ca-activated chloride channel homolog
LYKMGKFKDASGYFQRANSLSKTGAEIENSFYNLGNSYLKQGAIEESISAYKNALKANPENNYAKYNLSYAIALRKQLQKQQPPKTPPPPKQNEQKPSDKENKPGKNEPKPPANDSKKQPGIIEKQEQDKSGISDPEAERILDALKNDEQKIRNRLNETKKRQKYRQADKPW